MKVFLSWSGDLSREIAKIIRQYLPCMIQGAEVFMSQHDLESGSRWGAKLAKELEEAHFGIICLTATNLSSLWISFEAGALTKHVEGGACALLLNGLTPAAVSGPLSQFQNRVFNEAGLKSLIQDLNQKLSNPLNDKQVKIIFEKFWPDIEKEYKNAISTFSHPNTIKVRDQQELLEEILLLVRGMDRRVESNLDISYIDQGIRTTIPKDKITILIEEPFQPENIAIPYDPNFKVKELLDLIYHKLSPAVEPYTFGVQWTLKDDLNGHRLGGLEALATKRENSEFDELCFKDVGLISGMVLRTLVLDR